jgi:hypothetical protein
MSKHVTRKEFLKRAGLLSFGALSASALITACGGGGEESAAESASKGPMKAPPPAPKKKEVESTPQPAAEETADVDCSQFNANLTEQDKATRTAVKYVEKSTEPGKQCTNCRFWQPDKHPGACGGCQLFANGAVNPNGYCASWAEQV